MFYRQANKVLKEETDMFLYYFTKLELSKPTEVRATPLQSPNRSTLSVDVLRQTSRGGKAHSVIANK